MTFHLAYAVGIVVLAASGFRRIPLALFITYPLFLLNLPPTETDFPAYQTAFEQLRFDRTARYWYRGGSGLTAEPPWKWWNLFAKQVVFGDFRWFLVLNYWICLAIITRAVSALAASTRIRNVTLALMVPVVFPTIFFWSPRSSISLAFCLLGVALVTESKTLQGGLALLVGSSLHSQFLVVTLFIMLFTSARAQRMNQVTVRATVIATVTIALIGTADGVLGFFEFLPNFEVLSTKLSQFESSRTGFRLTGLLSIAVIPVGAIAARDQFRNERVSNLLIGLAIFGAIVNLFFFTSPHLAGRLARLSDYLLLPLVGATLVTTRLARFDRVVVAVIPVLAVPFAYPTLY